MVTPRQPRPKYSLGGPDVYTLTNRRKPWFTITRDSGAVFRTEVVTVSKKGGKLRPDGPMGMVITLDMHVTVTYENAIMLKLADRLGELFVIPEIRS